MRVFVYFNLQRKVWSLRALDGANKGRVVAHATKVLLRAAEFKVSEAGRQRVIKNNRKNVHAGVAGTLEAFVGEARHGWGDGLMFAEWWHDPIDNNRYARFAIEQGTSVTYNPYKFTTFVDVQDNSNAVVRSDMVSMVVNGCGTKVFAFDPCAMPEGKVAA